jgi:HupE / UreJ protein.
MTKLITVLISLIICVFSISLSADEYRPAYLQLKQTTDNTFDVVWKLPSTKQNQILNLTVKLPSDTKLIKPKSIRPAGAATIEQFAFSSEKGLVGNDISITGLANAPTEVLVRIQWLSGITETARLDSSKTAFTVVGTPSFSYVVKTYLVFGFEHILEGFDHLLFVACLIFIAGTWRRILITITGFTIAHSITLTMAALGLISLPITAVESVIALSIVFLAREIMLKNTQTLTWRYPIAVSASFGLLHGFGFASALSDIGLPQTEIPAALLAFNIGVELGQIVFVGVLLIITEIIRRLFISTTLIKVLNLKRIEQTGALFIGVTSMYWVIERVTGL